MTAVAAAALLAGCNKAEPEKAAPAPTPMSVAAPAPDVGKLSNVQTTAQGYGASPGEAVAEAMKLAILQVNGAAVQSASVSVKFGLDVSLGQDAASLRGSAFADAVTQRSGGVIQNFKLVEMKEPGVLGGQQYKATIEAQIAKFQPSAEMQKVKLVIGQIRFDSASVPMGDRSVSSAEVAATLRQRISDALVQTGRFAVLDREFSPDIQGELDMISSGQAPSAELAKLSQAASADLVWSGRVSNLAYNRHARQLKTSERELVSYSGGWALTEKLVNVATRQVMASDALRGTVPSTEATTLGRGVDGGKVLEDMSTDLVNQVVTSVLRRTFPVTVVSRDGANVVLSQGGQALKEGARYAMVTMGAEMKDPQTGQSLGRVESPCCELVIERVTPNLSYGRLENVRANLDQLPAGALQLRDALKGVAVTKVSAATDMPAAGGTATLASTTPMPGQTRRTAAPVATPAAPSKNDEKW
ncbi:CsgG/HfaB family protein [Variovorax ginsengisoli]|uniref:Curli biogenesis system outer membrane secretion channel CsgG n=1 Tax=Variovorax ginsengisoli TaxID=363844 RepID=A0ABT9SEH8_9BURK|nr:CsgG/HfaB family protein [Variovorax ginsengisoli]MDP9902146.1 curli biogenesis system outer membrane secretion channel CsgG [Variovorax ginsengisoli]